MIKYEGEDFYEIPGYQGQYLITTQGKVLSTAKGRKLILNTYLDKGGYVRVSLSLGDVQKRWVVHRLVASTFLPNPNNLPQVNHIDNNKLNNSVVNLEWCSSQHNVLHSYKLGNRSNPRGGDHPSAIKVINLDTREIFNSISEAARSIGKAPGDVSMVCRGLRKTVKGTRWAYLD